MKPDNTKYCLGRSDLLVRNEPFYISIENIGLKRSFRRPSKGKTAQNEVFFVGNVEIKVKISNSNLRKPKKIRLKSCSVVKFIVGSLTVQSGNAEIDILSCQKCQKRSRIVAQRSEMTGSGGDQIPEASNVFSPRSFATVFFRRGLSEGDKIHTLLTTKYWLLRSGFIELRPSS